MLVVGTCVVVETTVVEVANNSGGMRSGGMTRGLSSAGTPQAAPTTVNAVSTTATSDRLKTQSSAFPLRIELPRQVGLLPTLVHRADERAHLPTTARGRFLRH